MRLICHWKGCREYAGASGLCGEHESQVRLSVPTAPDDGWRDGDEVLIVDPLCTQLRTRIDVGDESRWGRHGSQSPARMTDARVETLISEGFVHWVGLVAREDDRG